MYLEQKNSKCLSRNETLGYGKKSVSPTERSASIDSDMIVKVYDEPTKRKPTGSGESQKWLKIEKTWFQ